MSFYNGISLPLSLSFEEFIDSFLSDYRDVLSVCISVYGVQEIQFFTPGNLIALPASPDIPFNAAFPDFAERRAAAFPTAFRAPEFHHLPEQFIAFPVIFECTAEGRGGECLSKFLVVYIKQLLAEIAGKIRDSPGMAVTVKTAEPAIGHQRIGFHRFHRRGEGSAVPNCFPLMSWKIIF
jgi:hypothetical protein